MRKKQNAKNKPQKSRTATKKNKPVKKLGRVRTLRSDSTVNRPLTKNEKRLSNALATLFKKIEKQEYSQRPRIIKSARKKRNLAQIKKQNFTGKEKYRYVYYVGNSRREKYLTHKQIKKLIPRNTDLIYFVADKTFRTIKTYQKTFNERANMKFAANRDFDYIVSLVAPDYISLFNRVRKPYELYSFHLEYFDGKQLAQISTPLSDFDNFLIEQLDPDEIYNQFIKDPLETLLSKFLETIEKYLAKHSTEIYFTRLVLKIYNDLPAKD